MSEFLKFALLGMGVGAVYTLLAHGLVVIHRVSGVLNFALGAQAMASAFLFYELREKHDMGTVTAMLIAVVASAVLGVLIHLLVMAPLANSAPLVRVTAALSIMVILQTLASMRYKGQTFKTKHPFLPRGTVDLPFDATLGKDRLWVAGIAVVLTIVLALGFRFLLIGRATEAVAANPRLAASLGWSPNLVGAVNWGIGSALAGFAGILLTAGGKPALVSLNVMNLTLVIIPALAVAMLAGFRSFWLTCLAGFAVGIAESEMTRYIHHIGMDRVAPLAVILVVLLVSGRGIPQRDFAHEKLPAVGPAFPKPLSFVIGTIVAVVLIFFISDSYSDAMVECAIVGILLISVVVITGFAGQLSLAQYAIAGIAAFTASRLSFTQHWPFEVCFVIGVATAIVVGSLFALPALRARGATLTVLTLCLGQVVNDAWLTNTKYTGGFVDTHVGAQTVFGISIDPVNSPDRYAAFSAVLLLICLLVAGCVRRSRSGRRLLAVRENERAAVALGINVTSAKVYAFAVASGIAGVAGVLMGFKNYSVDWQLFQTFFSINLIMFAVLAGIGYLSGQPFICLFSAVGGVGTLLFRDIGWDEKWVALIGGFLTIITLITAPNGIAANPIDPRKRKPKVVTEADAIAEAAPAAQRPVVEGLTATQPKALEMSGITVRFGGVVALSDVNFSAHPGEIVGLIGPNGAGKTTLIDVASGFVHAASGTVVLGGQNVTRASRHARARAGLSRSFQSLELFDDLTVRENLLTASDTRDGVAYLTNLVWPGSLDLPPAAQAAVDIFGLGAVLDKKPPELPYGLRRLVAIARAAAGAPSVIMLDEPAAGLSRAQTDELGRLIKILAKQMGLAVVLVEHDLQFVLEIADRMVVLDRGKHLAEGEPHEVVALKAVRAAYLGAEEEDAAAVAVVEESPAKATTGSNS